MRTADSHFRELLGIRNRLQESILDPPSKKRADWLFDENEKVRKDVKKQIYSILRKWKEQINFDFEIEAIKQGSALVSVYRRSDIDVTVLTTMTKNSRRIIYFSERSQTTDGKKVFTP